MLSTNYPPRFQQTWPQLRNGVAQPDDREHRQGGDEEACMAVLNDFYGDGLYFEYLYLYFHIFCVYPAVRPLKAIQLHTIERWKTIAKKIYVLSKNKKRLFHQGIKWHDVACHHEKPIICEDEPGHLR